MPPGRFSVFSATRRRFFAAMGWGADMLGRRLLSFLGAAALGSALMANGGAAGAASRRVPVPVEEFVDPCPTFDVAEHVVASKVYEMDRVAKDGTIVIHFSGTFVIELTNMTSEKSLTFNAGGPVSVTVAPDGTQVVVARGLSLGVFDAATAAKFKVPMLAYSSGRITLVQDASGAATAITTTGNLRDVCALLS